MKELHILNLGAGVQSTTLYLMFLRGDLTPQIDYAIFADTGEEPTPVYRHLEWLQSLNGPRILVRSIGRLGEHLKHGRNSTGQRFASIPAYTTDEPGSPKGMLRRQCTKEYKLEVIEQTIRHEIVGLKPRQWFPHDEIHVHQYIGISFDEAGRAARIRLRFAEVPWATPVFPLIERQITRDMCQQRLKGYGVPHEVPRSACVFCPYRSNEEWRWLRDNDPAGFQRAVEIDVALRTPGHVVNRNLDQKLYVHRSCVPLAEAFLEKHESFRDRTFMGFSRNATVCAEIETIKLMKKSLFIIPLACAACFFTGCAAVTRTATDVGLGAGGAALGGVLSKGNPYAIAGGAAGGVLLGEGLHYANSQLNGQSYQTGYDRGRSDAVKQQYWLYVSMQQAKAGDDGRVLLYEVHLPEQVIDGVIFQPTTQFLRIEQ